MAKRSGTTKSTGPGSSYNNESQYDHEDYMETSGERIDYIMDATGVDKSKANLMMDALLYYTHGGYGTYAVKANSKLLEEFIEKAPKWDGGTLYRGTTTDFSNAKVGDIISRSFSDGSGRVSSWSSDKWIAAGSGDDTLLRVTGKVNGTSVQFLSSSPDEKEVLMSGNARFKITNISYELGQKVIDLKVYKGKK